MSNVSIAHTLEVFSSKTSVALSGQRLAKIKYKNTDKTPAKFPSVCASVPFISSDLIIGNVDRLVPYFRTFLESAQDGIIRSLYESSEGSLSQILDSEIGIDSICGFLEAESTGGRLTKEFIESWFSSAVSDTLYVVIADKLKYDGLLTPEQEITVQKHIKGYKDMYSSLAGGKTFYQPSQVKSLRNVLALIETDETSAKLDARLGKMLEVKPIEELLEL